MKKNRILTAFGYLFAILIAVICLFPLIWMFLAGFKSKTEAVAIPLKLLPEEWLLANYQTVLNDKFITCLITTFLVSITACLLSLLVNTMAGYVFARLDFYGKRFFWAYCLISMFMPGITIQITSFLVVQKLNMLNTFGVLVIPGLASGYNIFFFRQFFLNIPMALEDAARIDGCGRFRIYKNIFLPLTKGPMVVMGVGYFLGCWNQYMWPMLTISNSSMWKQVQQYIQLYKSSYSTEYGLIMAASTIAMVPPLILFAFFQKQITKGYVISGLK